MIFRVQMLANNPDDWFSPRPVMVPDDEISEGTDVLAILERIFHWGQNMHQHIFFQNEGGNPHPIPCCSVSMGDVAEIVDGGDTTCFLCMASGWEYISPEALVKYKAIPRRDRSFSAHMETE